MLYQSGTEELCRMLNISSMSDGNHAPKNVALPHSVVIEASTGKKQYGIPLTLDQLFAGKIREVIYACYMP